ncbi:nardilysin-like [Ornithodoros turicata]|uniref:nardilysin-like n=1 Tax=Ornithodoros turicata TaxID=34597 RepID=UPI00313860D9
MESSRTANNVLPYKVIRLDNGLTAVLVSEISPLPTSLPSLPSCSSPGTSNRELSAPESKTSLQIDNLPLTRELLTGAHGSARSREHIDVGYDQHGRPELDRRQSLKSDVPAAAALCVGVGSFHEPENLQGLAHLLEHAVVLGNKKYPNEDDCYSYLSLHGGSANAHTFRETTVFSMDVQQENLAQALDMFANIFIEPLLRVESMDRELEGLQNEYLLELSSDSCRMQQLLGNLSCEGHPMRKFVCGNLDTLKKGPAKANIDVNAAMRTFFEEHYCPEKMTLAVRSRHPLEELEEIVTKSFSAIPARCAKQVELNCKNLSMDAQFPRERFSYILYKMQPVRKACKLSVTWALPSMIQEYKTKPIEYIAWLVGHEDAGSILAYLRERGWALNLFAGNTGSSFEQTSLYSLFNIYVSLTDEGLKNVKRVLTVIFGYLAMVCKLGPDPTIFEEIKKIGDLNYGRRSGVDPQDYVTKLCQNMQVYPPHHYFTGDCLLYEYNTDIIQRCMDLMTPERANVILLTSRYRKRASVIQVEPYLQSKYTMDEVPDEWKKEWSNIPRDPYFRIPGTNKYIATDFSIKSETEHLSDLPIKLHDDERYRLWYKFGGNFEDPKACLYFHFISPLPQASPENGIMLALFVDILQHNMRQETAAARRASLESLVYVSWTGLVIQVSGFVEKLPLLFDVILDHVCRFETREDHFESVKDDLYRYYYNVFAKPSRLADDVRISILRQNYWTTVEKRALVKGITLSSLNRFVEEFRSKMHIEGFAQGNLTSAEALNVAERMVKKLECKPLAPADIPQPRVMQLPVDSNYCRVATFNIRDSSSVVTNYYQKGLGDVTQHALASLMIDFMEGPCFDVLRTKAQVGYDVSCHNKNTFGVVGFAITVTFSAKKFACTFVDEEIEAFLRKFSAKIQQMTDKQFQSRVQSLMKRKSVSDFTLKDEADLYWEEITSAGYVFDRLTQEVEFLKTLSSDDFKGWCISLLPFNSQGGGAHRRKLSIQVVGSGEAALAESRSLSSGLLDTQSSSGTDMDAVTDTSAFYRGQELHPWIPRKGKRSTKAGVSSSSSEDMIYCLQYMEPAGASKQEFITDVAKFKQQLSVCAPVNPMSGIPANM